MKSIKEMAVDYYNKGLWSKIQIEELVKVGKLSQKDADNILFLDKFKKDKE